MFDKGTVEGRILKDDTSIIQCLDQFTLAQIMRFINQASNNNCVNCLAALMEHKNTKYPSYDSMDEFTLE